MSTPDLPMQGECRCGQIKLEIVAYPALTMICHCTGCQKMSSSAYSLSASIPAESFSVTVGEPVIGGLHAGSKHFFCPHCMSWLFTRLEGLDSVVNIRMTMFEKLNSFAPFVEMYTSEKLPWIETPVVHSFEKFPAFDAFSGLMGDYACWSGRNV